MTDCPAEQVSQHANSPCVVAGKETVCRAAYDPMHTKSSGGIANSFIKSADLLAGELSVWRLARDPAFDIAALAGVLQAGGPAENTLKQICAATALAVRGVRVEALGDDQRVFCVLDDCATDDDGGWHCEHAVIALETIENVVWQIQTEPFVAAREGLTVLLKRTAVLWPLAA